MSTPEALAPALRRDASTPLYAQLEEILRAKIEDRDWRPGDRVPSENELSSAYGVSRMTARGVLNSLANDGILVRVPGKGTFVAEPKIETVPPAYRGVREQLEMMGLENTTRLVRAERERPSAALAAMLHLDRNEEVHAIVRVRYVRGHPISLHHSWIPARLAEDLDAHDTVSRQLCAVLSEDFGLRMSRTSESLETTVLSGEEAHLLGLEEGQPVLLLQDALYTEDGIPFEFTKIIFRGDKVRLHFTYNA